MAEKKKPAMKAPLKDLQAKKADKVKGGLSPQPLPPRDPPPGVSMNF